MADPTVTIPIQFIPSATAVMIKDGKVYAHFRRNTGALKGFWATAGGKFELEPEGVPQRAEDAAADELLQEAGIDVHGEKGRLLFLSAVPEVSDKGIFLCHVYLLKLQGTEAPRNTEPEKHDDYLLDSVEGHLGRKLLPGIALALKYLRAHPELLA